ncbi:MAG: hypothetical protein IJO45_00080 [Oscillospiraceae bacterium]|nr:hypothetical protein [Oscillospiraceae bacterium]
MKNKLLSMLLAAVISFGLWMYVITVVQPESTETYYNIPVVLQNESILAERGLMIVSERPEVTLELSGARTHLNQLNESNINVITNVSSIVTPGTHELTYNVSYPGTIPSGAITPQNSSPDMVTLKVEKKISKPVQVVPEYTGSVPEGLIADKENVALDYATIDVSGPESVLSQITQAKIYVDLEGQTETVVGEYTYTLCNEAGEPVDSQWVTTSVEAVNLTLTIRRVKEITLVLNVTAGGGATEATSSIDIQPKTIRVSGSEALLEGLDTLEIGTIDLGQLPNDETLTFPVVLPEGIINETGITEATVEVKFPNLRTVTLNVDKIQLANVPEGLVAELVTQVLELKLRGPASLLDGLTAEKITVTVDLAQAQAGTDKYAVQIVLPEDAAGVGALGTYTVMVTLTEAEET